MPPKYKKVDTNRNKNVPKSRVHLHICCAWYNGSYTMATKPIKFLELHYTMTQFLIVKYIKYIILDLIFSHDIFHVHYMRYMG